MDKKDPAEQALLPSESAC